MMKLSLYWEVHIIIIFFLSELDFTCRFVQSGRENRKARYFLFNYNKCTKRNEILNTLEHRCHTAVSYIICL